MLFTNKQEIITKTGESKKYDVILACTLKDKAIPATAILSDLTLYEIVTRVYSAKVVKTFEMKNPVLVFDGATNDILDISSLYSQVIPIYTKSTEMYEKVKPQILGLLRPQLKDEAQFAEMLLDTVISHYKILNGENIIDTASFSATQILPEFLEDTMNFINAQKSKEIFTENRFQKTCTDSIMFRLPSRDEMENEDIKTSEIMPTLEQICEPYKYADAYEVFYDAATSRVPRDYFPYIEGKVENNTLPIQENEKEFYDILVEWMLNNLRFTYAEKLDGMQEKDYVLDSTTEAYLNMLIERVYRWHWGHSEHVPAKIKENIHDDFTDDDSDSGAEKSNYEFTRKPGNEDKPVYAAYESLRKFLRQAAQQLTYKVYAEAIVKIARWGDRKPKALVFEDYNYTFDLGKGLISTSLGSITDYDTVVDNNGHTHVPNFAIYCKTSIADKKFAIDQGYSYSAFGMPIGISFAQFFVNKKDESKRLTLARHLTMPEVIKELYSHKAGMDTEIVPVGMYVDDEGSIRVTKEITNDKNNTFEKLHDVYTAKKSTLLANPFYSKGMNNVYLELNLTDSNKEPNLFKVLTDGLQTTDVVQSMTEQQFSSKEELIESFQSGKIWDMDTSINLNIYKELYPIYFSVAKKAVACLQKQKLFSIEDVLNWFKDAMLETDYKWETGFLKEIKQPLISMKELYSKAIGATENETPVTAEMKNDSETAPLEKMQLFGAVEEPAVEEPVVEEPVVEEPAVEEPVAEEPVAEEPAVEEPAVEEPAVEEPVAVEEPAVEEPLAEELLVEKVPVSQNVPTFTERVVEKVVEKVVVEKVPMTSMEFIENNFLRKVTNLNASNVFHIFNSDNEFIGYVHMEAGATPAETIFTVLEDKECAHLQGINREQAIKAKRLCFHVIKQLYSLSQGNKSLIYFSSKNALKSFCISINSELNPVIQNNTDC